MTSADIALTSADIATKFDWTINSADKKYEFRRFTILDAILKMLSIFRQKITLFKIQQIRPIGLRRRCLERYINQKNFTVINVIVCLTTAHN